MTPVKYEDTIESIIPDGITMELKKASTLLLTGLYKEARKIKILPAMNTPPPISLGFLRYYVCIITLDKQTIKVHNNGQKILTENRNNHNRMWEVPLLKDQDKYQTEAPVESIMTQTTKQELANYYHDSLFNPTNKIIPKTIKQGFLKT